MRSKEDMDYVQRIEGLLVIGGSTRNVGKTTLICNIIRHFAKLHQIVGLKIKTLYHGDQLFHGNDLIAPNENFSLIEEFDFNNEKDSSGMLKAGAKRAFRLKTPNSKLHLAFQYFIEQNEEKTLMICESNSLRRVIIPDLFMLIKHHDNQNMKPSAVELERFADRVIFTDGAKHNFDLSEINVQGGKWVLNN